MKVLFQLGTDKEVVVLKDGTTHSEINQQLKIWCATPKRVGLLMKNLEATWTKVSKDYKYFVVKSTGQISVYKVPEKACEVFESTLALTHGFGPKVTVEEITKAKYLEVEKLLA